MNSFAVLLLCVQACLVQNVFGQSMGRLPAPAGCAPAAAVATTGFAPNAFAGPAALGAPFAGPLGYPAGIGPLGYPASSLAAPCGLDAYGGAGEGNVAVIGELPVAGTTAIAGQVPVMGAVSFSGPVPAAGIVSISGNCACGCGTPYGSPFFY